MVVMYKCDVHLRHGAAIYPKTMAIVCEDLGLIERWQTVELEGGKNYPETIEGEKFPGFPDDVMSAAPPADGYILSGGKDDDRDCLNFTNDEMRAKIDDVNFDWGKSDAVHKVKAGDTFTSTFEYHAIHKTRGYDWWITKQPVDFSYRLTRDDFDNEPFYKDYSNDTPYWSHALPISKETSVTIPTNTTSGLYVLLERWIIADTGMAFHSSWILDIENSGSSEAGIIGNLDISG